MHLGQDSLFYLSASYVYLDQEAQRAYDNTLNQPDDSPFRQKIREPDLLMRFDKFKRLRQVSVMFTELSAPVELLHFVLSDSMKSNEEWNSSYKNLTHTELCVFDTEASLVSTFWRTVRNKNCSSVAGWKIASNILPLLVCKGIEHGVKIPEAFLADPFSHYKPNCVYNVDAIYTQGVYSHARYAPELHELMSWWGIQTDDGWPMLDRTRLAMLDDEKWKNYGLCNVEKYLHGMHAIVELYRRCRCSATYAAENSRRGPAKLDQTEE